MSDNQTPSLSEKVKFWQEQDQINKAIIPRIIDLHEQVARITKRLAKLSPDLASSHARTLKNAEQLADKIARSIVTNEITKELSEVRKRMRAITILSIISVITSVIAVIAAIAFSR